MALPDRPLHVDDTRHANIEVSLVDADAQSRRLELRQQPAIHPCAIRMAVRDKVPSIKDTVLQPVAFTIQPDWLAKPIAVAALRFPPEWVERLYALERELQYPRPPSKVRLPVRELNGVVAAFVGQLLALPDTQWAKGYWLLAREPVPPSKLIRVIRMWMDQRYGGEETWENFAAIADSFQAEDLVWDVFEHQISTEVSSKNNTATPGSLDWTVVPVWFADQIVQRGVTIKVGGEQRGLVRVPAPYGAELMTWSPRSYPHPDRPDEHYYYSYTIRVTLQTIWGSPEPRLHCHYGVRRWVSQPIYDGQQLFMGRTARSVYLHNEEPWLGLPPSPAFTLATVQAVSQDGKRVPQWTNRLPDVVKRLQVAFPAAQEVVSNPGAWLRGEQGVVAAMVEHTPRNQPIGAGVDMQDHAAITRAIQTAFMEELVLTPPMVRVPELRKAPNALKKPLRELSREDRLQALVDSVGPEVTIEIIWTQPHVRDMLVDRLKALLLKPTPLKIPRHAVPYWKANYKEGETDLAALQQACQDLPLPDEIQERVNRTGRMPAEVKAPDPDPDPNPEDETIPLPGGGRLRLILKAEPEIVDVLPESPRPITNAKERAKYRLEMANKRLDLIRQRITETATKPTLTIVEMPNWQAPKTRRQFGLRDPKRAVRYGLAQRRRITKFVTGDEKHLKEKCEKTVLDGLRQLGYLTAPPTISFLQDHSFPRDLLIVGVWMLRLTKKRGFCPIHLPVVVLMSTQSSQIEAWIPDGKGRRLFWEALLDITTMPPEEVRERTRRADAQQALYNFLADLPRGEQKDVVVLVEAQNIRSSLTGFKNPDMVKGEFRVADDGMARPVAELPGSLRIIRLRSSQRYEAPEWYIPDRGAEAAGTVGQANDGDLTGGPDLSDADEIEAAEGLEREDGTESKDGQRYAQGVWCDPRIPDFFYNNSERPKSQGGLTGKQLRPSEQHAIPSLLEITPVAIAEGERPETWALAIDQWRRMSIVLNEGMTLLPLPLQMTKKMDKYAAVIGPWVWTEEWHQEEQPLDGEDMGDEDSTVVADEEDDEDMSEDDQRELVQFVLDI